MDSGSSRDRDGLFQGRGAFILSILDMKGLVFSREYAGGEAIRRQLTLPNHVPRISASRPRSRCASPRCGIHAFMTARAGGLPYVADDEGAAGRSARHTGTPPAPDRGS